MKNFYKDIYECLTDEGIFAAQTETPFYLPEVVQKVFKDVKDVFQITKLFMAAIPTYPGGYWSFTIGSKVHDPENVNIEKIPDFSTKYYTPELSCPTY